MRNRRKPRHLESAEGQALMKWARMSTKAHPELDLLHHIPNGGKRSKVEAAIMKAEGVKPGIPDYDLPVARGGFIGLRIELKAPGNHRVSKDQREVMEALRAEGHRCEVAVGWLAAVEIIEDYLSGERTI